jgi:hypothetical protein
MTKRSPAAIPNELIEQKICLIRRHKVMLDTDLAALYGVTTGNLNLAVRRNPKRFPPDFMFQLSQEETKSLLLQTARAKVAAAGERRHTPSPSRASPCSQVF